MKRFRVHGIHLVPLRFIVIAALLIALILSSRLITQQNPNSIIKSTSLLGQFFGPEVLGVHLNQNLSQRVSLNLGLGIGLDAHIGFNGYFTNRTEKRLAFYDGAQFTIVREVRLILGAIFNSSGSSTADKRDSQVGLYIPFGLEYIATKGFTIQLDIGPNFVKDDWNQINTASIMGSLKIGYTFRAKP